MLDWVGVAWTGLDFLSRSWIFDCRLQIADCGLMSLVRIASDTVGLNVRAHSLPFVGVITRPQRPYSTELACSDAATTNRRA
jgi:hypothetical protein